MINVVIKFSLNSPTFPTKYFKPFWFDCELPQYREPPMSEPNQA